MYVVKYSGPFGFIKPWTAVRDNETYSQNFLTPSTLEGIEKKLFPELLEKDDYEKRIIRHRLTYDGLSKQQEQTQPRTYNPKVAKKEGSITFERDKSILIRGIMVNPVLFLALSRLEYAQDAVKQHICLCRNEDILLPQSFENDTLILEVSENEFDKTDNGFNGFELIFGKSDRSFIVGFNRFHENQPMYGSLNIVGSNPLQNSSLS